MTQPQTSLGLSVPTSKPLHTLGSQPCDMHVKVPGPEPPASTPLPEHPRSAAWGLTEDWGCWEGTGVSLAP